MAGYLKINMLLITVISSLTLLVSITSAASKPGDCPPIDEDYMICAMQINPCKSDTDCKGAKKCCWTGCSPVCMEPLKPGYCPAVKIDEVGDCIKECQYDHECSGTDKCCGNGCGRTCQRARTSKPGECPPIDEDNILCVKQLEGCGTDMDCEGVEKCCWTGCSPLCMKPAPRDGFCPSEREVPESCDYPSCVEDYDCEPQQKCCSACGAKKCLPAEVPKAGTCPVVEEGMMGICMEGCSRDSECEGEQKCCSNGCGHACKPPTNASCTVLGKEYPPGPVPDPSGCNTCHCGEKGELICTKMMCECEIRGVPYSMGEMYPVGDGCNECMCRGYNDNLGSHCTDYYCGSPEQGERKAQMNTWATLTVCVGVFGIIVIISIFAFLFVKHRSQSKRSAKVDGDSKTKDAEDAEPLPVKA